MSKFLWWSNQVKPSSGLKNAHLIPIISEIYLGLNPKFYYIDEDTEMYAAP
jgi:hypothetical protein